MAQTYAIYFGALFIIGILALFADKYNKKKLVWLIIGILTMVAGIRKCVVGIDSYPYYEKFKLIAAKEFDAAYGLETSFKYICYFLLKISNDYTFLFSVFAFITNYCIVIRLWDMRKMSSFSCAVLCYYMGFFFMSMNVSRQFVSIAIIFYATKYLVNRKYLAYIIGVFIASLFHQSACVGVILLAVELFDWKSLTTKQRIGFLTIILLSPTILYFIIQRMLKYEKYIRNANVDVGMMVFVKLLFLIASLVFLFVLNGNGNSLSQRRNMKAEEKRSVLLICVSYFIGILFALASYIFTALNRVGWYFIIFESVYFGMLVKGKNPANKLVFIYVITFIMGYAFIYSITNNSQGVVPYLFFWQ